MKKQTYFIPKDDLFSSDYYEIQQGKYSINFGKIKLDNSIYFYASTIIPFAYIIKNFAPYGITYVNKVEGQVLVEDLRQFATLLGNGEKVYSALEIMKIYNPAIDGSWQEEDDVAEMDLNVLQNTTEELANWIENTFKKYKIISILGL